MKIRYVWEHNGNDTLLFAADFPGAYARGASRDEALAKLPDELRAFLRWTNAPVPAFDAPELVQEQESALQISDADSDVLFASEREPLTEAEYAALKAQVLRSAADFLTLYRSAPDENVSCLPVRQTFYGRAPRTANEMYAHTKNVNDYYFGEIGVAADCDGTIFECRQRGFAALEQLDGFLRLPAREGSYGEWWSLRKVLRRFLWHDRIHAKAMYRMLRSTFADAKIPNPYCF